MPDISQDAIPDSSSASLTDRVTGLYGGASRNFSLSTVKQLFDTPVINPQSAGYTLLDSDHGSVIEINSSTPVNVTIPSSLRVRFACMIVQMGTGLVTIVAGAGVNSRGGSALGGQYGSAVIMGRALNDYYVFAGGATTGGTGGGTTTLSAPVLSAGTPTTTTIPLTWTDTNTSPNESSFEIQISTDGGTTWGAATPGTAAANATSSTETGLTASTAYKFRTRAVGDGTTTITSAWSNVVTVSTSGASNADANAYIAAVQATGETVSSGRQAAIQTLFASLASNGIKALITGFAYLPVWTRDTANRIELYGRTAWDETNPITDTVNGVQGNGNDYCDTHVNPSTALLQNDCSIGWYCNSSSKTNAFESAMGCMDGTNYLQILYGSGVVYASVNAAQNVIGSAAIAKGFDVADRSDSANVKFIRQGSVLLNVADASTGRPANTVSVLASKNNIGSANYPTTMKGTFYYAGRSMESAGKTVALSTIVNQAMTDLGVV